jgi:hypothetical protein
MIEATLEASNQADWFIQITAVDDDTGDVIDFTAASIAFIVKDTNGCTRLTATTNLANITINSTLIEIHFTPTDMQALCASSYTLGCVYNINSETTQLLKGTVAVYDGIGSL